MNPTYLTSLARIIQIVLPQFSKRSDAPQQCLSLQSENGEISVMTSSDGVTMTLSGDAEEVVSVIYAKMLNIEIEVSSAPGINGPADMVFVAKNVDQQAAPTSLSFKCVYLPKTAPSLISIR